jgi:hypothetical protein
MMEDAQQNLSLSPPCWPLGWVGGETTIFPAGYLTTNRISAPAIIFCPAIGCWATTIEAGDGVPACEAGARSDEFVCEFPSSVITGF